MINLNSVSETIDHFDEAFFWNKKISQKDQRAGASFLANQFDSPGGYRGLLTPGPDDRNKGNPKFKNQVAQFFTGEKIKSSASYQHILAEEGMRILKLLKPKQKSVLQSLANAKERLHSIFIEDEELGYNPGRFCCGNCTASFWRNLMANEWVDLDKRLHLGMKYLKKHRLGDGKWKKFPFHYTSLVLTEMEPKYSLNELQYIAPRHEAQVKRLTKALEREDDVYTRRKLEVSNRVLALV